MISKLFRLVPQIVSYCIMISCSSVNSPEDTVKQFYQYLNKGEYSKAKQLYTIEAKQMVEGQFMAMGGGFSKWADAETKNGAVKEIKIAGSQIRGEGASVQYEIVYVNGETKRKSVSLTKENGSWKIGLIQ